MDQFERGSLDVSFYSIGRFDVGLNDLSIFVTLHKKFWESLPSNPPSLYYALTSKMVPEFPANPCLHGFVPSFEGLRTTRRLILGSLSGGSKFGPMCADSSDVRERLYIWTRVNGTRVHQPGIGVRDLRLSLPSWDPFPVR